MIGYIVTHESWFRNKEFIGVFGSKITNVGEESLRFDYKDESQVGNDKIKIIVTMIIRLLKGRDNADWWKMTSEQAKKMVEDMSNVYMGM